MDAAYVLLAVIVALIGVVAKVIHDVSKKCQETSEEMFVLKTKMDIYLELVGLDVHKVNKVIEDHRNELKDNSKPLIGCISIKELYRDKKD